MSSSGAFESPRLDGVAVLVVDDQPADLDLVREILERYGARVQTASSAGAALAAFEKHPPDVLVADINMPDMDGYELIERVRALDPARGGRVPAAALTAFTGTEDRMRALKAGYQLHVPKPVIPGQLANVVASLSRPTGNWR